MNNPTPSAETIVALDATLRAQCLDDAAALQVAAQLARALSEEAERVARDLRRLEHFSPLSISLAAAERIVERLQTTRAPVDLEGRARRLELARTWLAREVTAARDNGRSSVAVYRTDALELCEALIASALVGVA